MVGIFERRVAEKNLEKLKEFREAFSTFLRLLTDQELSQIRIACEQVQSALMVTQQNGANLITYFDASLKAIRKTLNLNLLMDLAGRWAAFCEKNAPLLSNTVGAQEKQLQALMHQLGYFARQIQDRREHSSHSHSR